LVSYEGLFFVELKYLDSCEVSSTAKCSTVAHPGEGSKESSLRRQIGTIPERCALTIDLRMHAAKGEGKVTKVSKAEGV
jgi:hypothetical protein